MSSFFHSGFAFGQVVPTRRIAARRYAACGLVVTLWIAAVSGVRAFSDVAEFAAPAFEGGGDGRYFTGSPRDGLSCSVCHSGADAPHIEIVGLPRVLVPGESRDVLIRWPTDAGSHALQLELMSRDGAHAALELPERDELPAESRCDQRADAEPAAFSVDIGERRILGVSDCGASELRFRFTTPDADELFFAIGVVRSDGSGTPEGDGVFEWRRRIGLSPVETELTAGCSALGGVAHGPRTACGLVFSLVWCRFRRRRAARRVRDGALAERPPDAARGSRLRYVACAWSVCLLAGCVADSHAHAARESADSTQAYVDEFAALLGAAGSRSSARVEHACGPDPSPLSRLHFRVRTVSGDGRYRPRNVGAIWVEDAEGRWRRTLARWGKQRAKWLTAFNAASGGDVTDAITSATLPSHEVHELDWDLRDASGCEVDNGRYALRLELTDWSGTGENMRIEFDKQLEPVAFEPADEATFRDLSLSLD